MCDGGGWEERERERDRVLHLTQRPACSLVSIWAQTAAPHPETLRWVLPGSIPVARPTCYRELLGYYSNGTRSSRSGRYRTLLASPTTLPTTSGPAQLEMREYYEHLPPPHAAPLGPDISVFIVVKLRQPQSLRWLQLLVASAAPALLHPCQLLRSSRMHTACTPSTRYYPDGTASTADRFYRKVFSTGRPCSSCFSPWKAAKRVFATARYDLAPRHPRTPRALKGRRCKKNDESVLRYSLKPSGSICRPAAQAQTFSMSLFSSLQHALAAPLPKPASGLAEWASARLTRLPLEAGASHTIVFVLAATDLCGGPTSVTSQRCHCAARA